MHTLFELIRLLTVEGDRTRKEPDVDINVFAFKENGESSMLALACSNGYILLRYCIHGKPSALRQLPLPGNKTVVSMCIDPTVSWLAVLTNDARICLLPALCLMDPDAKVDRLWNTEDATLMPVEKPRGPVSVIHWWHTLDDQHIAIIGTKTGELLFFDLVLKKVVCRGQVDAKIQYLSLICDDQQTVTSLLVTGSCGNQWKVLLETINTSTSRFSPDPEILNLDYDPIDGRSLPFRNIFNRPEEMKDQFLPTRFQQFQRSVMLSTQYAKGRHFLTAHCDRSSTLQVYDSTAEHLPLFVYKLPVGAYNTILTDRVIFHMCRVGTKKLHVLSNQRAETSIEEPQEFNKEASLQYFELPQEEKVLGLQKRTFPFYWHEKKERHLQGQSGTVSKSNSLVPAAWAIPLTSHTVLDGCLVFTNRSVYECRPRISPERLVLELAIQSLDAVGAEALGISIGMDITALFELSADYLLQTGQYKRAIRLFQLSKCSYVKRVTKLAKYGRLQEMSSLLHQVLFHKSIELSTPERKLLSSLALHCWVYQLSLPGSPDKTVHSGLRELLIGSFAFEEKLALRLLSTHGHYDLLLEFAKSRGMVLEALDHCLASGQFNLPPSLCLDLVSRGFSAHLLKAGKGLLVQVLPVEVVARLVLARPAMLLQSFVGEMLESGVGHLSLELLLQLAALLDPCHPFLQEQLGRHLSRNRTPSISSLSSTSSMISYIGDGNDFTLKTEMSLATAVKLANLFLVILLLIRSQKSDGTGDVPGLAEFLSSADSSCTESEQSGLPSTERKLALQSNTIAAGCDHAATIRNGDLFVWGRNTKGRLGLGDLIQDRMIVPPTRVENFRMLDMKVLSVACGGFHTVAITQQGVFGWGSSEYGQVGVGTRHAYSRPMLLEALSSETVVSVECGMYHSMALTAHSRVLTWGWGVHGQLGHGDIEDVLTPTVVSGLTHMDVVKLAAGYGHSLALTEKGQVLVFGSAQFGQMGLGNTTKQTRPVPLDTLPEKVSLIATKDFHCVAVVGEKQIYTWGCHPQTLRQAASSMRRARYASQMGNQRPADPMDPFLLPQKVNTLFIHSQIVQIACGSQHSAAVTVDGEIYSWGVNNEGQLGFGNKQNEKQPKMITQINDRHVVQLACGNAFNLALLNTNQLLVWGSNSSGQLGLPVSEEVAQHQRGGSSVYARKGAQPADVATVPLELQTLPPQDPQASPWDQSLASSDSEDWEARERLGLGGVGHRWNQVSVAIDTSKTETYTKDCFPFFIRQLQHTINEGQVLNTCMELQDWLSAAHVCLLHDHVTQAMCYRLKALSERKHRLTPEALLSYSSKIVEHHLELQIDKQISRSTMEEELRILCIEAMQHWERESLPVSSLEQSLMPHLSSLAPVLAPIVFRSPEKPGEPQSIPIPTFSTSFSLEVLQLLVQAQPEDCQSLAPWDLLLTPPKNAPGPELARLEELMGLSKLWQDILHHLEKSSSTQAAIPVGRNELEHLATVLQDAANEGGGEEASRIIFFSCGHNFPEKMFRKEVLPSFGEDLSRLLTRVPFTEAMLTQSYRLPGRMPLACPKCVLQLVRA